MKTGSENLNIKSINKDSEDLKKTMNMGSEDLWKFEKVNIGN